MSSSLRETRLRQILEGFGVSHGYPPSKEEVEQAAAEIEREVLPEPDNPDLLTIRTLLRQAEDAAIQFGQISYRQGYEDGERNGKTS